MVLQFCRSWNTCVKLSYDIPRSTHTYLVEHCLASEFTPVKTEMMARYIKFHRSLKNSKSFEVRALVNVVSNDIRSTTARNLALIETETGQSIRNLTPKLVRELVKIQDFPVNQDWRFSLLKRKIVASQLSSTDMLD